MDTSTFYVAYVHGSDTPAWVQAIGSILALAIAIGVPWFNHLTASKLRADERRRKGHAIAVLLRGSVEEWYRQFDDKLVLTADLYAEPIPVSGVIQDVLRTQPFRVPAEVLSNVRELEFLDHAGELLLQCIYASYELGRVTEKLVKALKRSPVDVARVALLSSAFFPGYTNQIEMLRKAMTEITNRFDLTEQLRASALSSE